MRDWQSIPGTFQELAQRPLQAAMASKFHDVLDSLVDQRPFSSLVKLADKPPLGDGRFGRVFQGVWLPNGQDIAVKVPLSANFATIGEPG